MESKGKLKNTVQPRSASLFEYNTLFRYAFLIAILAYLHYLQLPQLLKVVIDNQIQILSNQQQTTTAKGPAIVGAFDDEKFVQSYQCNKSHGYQVKILKRDPLLIYLENFLDYGEAEHLQAVGYPMMSRSTVVGENNEVHESRTSHNAFLSKQHDKVVQCIEERASKLSNLPIQNIEPLQVVWYRDGQEYQPHYDYFPPGTPGSDRELQRGGQRIITIFVYLNTVPEGKGGETVFPNLDMKVPAKKNDATFWYDMDLTETEDPRTFHGGAKVYNSEKWGANIWIRQHEFN